MTANASPITLTNPPLTTHRAISLRLPRLRPPVAHRVQVHRERLDAPPVHLAHGEHRVARRHAVAHDRQPAERAEDVAADRRVLVVGHLEAEPLVELPDVRRARDQHVGVRIRRRQLLRLVVLVEDLADDLLEQILHRHDARRAAVLVEHHRHVLLEPLEVGEHLLHLARARHHVHRAA